LADEQAGVIVPPCAHRLLVVATIGDPPAPDSVALASVAEPAQMMTLRA
jgi:hypothetical protein